MEKQGLLNMTKEEVLNMLNSSDYPETLEILLLMAEINLTAEKETSAGEELEEEKEKEKENEDEDVLGEENNNADKNPSNEIKQHKNDLLRGIREAIKAISERPRDFVGDDAPEKINRIVGKRIFPQDKKEVRRLSDKVLLSLLARIKRKEKEANFSL